MTNYLDVSALALWLGQPTGMTRVEAELARHAPAEVEFVVFDLQCDAYRPIVARFRDVLTSTLAALEPEGVSRGSQRTGWKRFTPSLLSAIMLFERARRTLPQFDGLFQRIQRSLLTARRASLKLADGQGRRFTLYEASEVLGDPVALQPGDRILVSGADWSRRDPLAFRNYVQGADAAIVSICYDLIPITRPHFFPPGVPEIFEAYWRQLLPISACILVTAQCVGSDIARFCEQLQLPCPPIVTHRLGADGPRPARTELPAELRNTQFALFVSTIEPRKNHAMLLRVWDRLVARGWPQAGAYRLVLVGRAGWMVEETLQLLSDDKRFGGTVFHYNHADDALLAALYAGCAFTLYPSIDEGFGLPIIESFSYGKAVVCSTGGALPEVVDGRAPMLEANDEPAWERTIVDWFERPGERRKFERLIDAGTPLSYEWSSVAPSVLHSVGLIA